MKFDLHLHTSRHSPDSETDPFDLLAAARKAGLDGIEVLSNNMDQELRVQAAALLTRYPDYAQLGNSDSHAPWSVGCCYTEFEAIIRTNVDLVSAIRGRKGTARENRS